MLHGKTNSHSNFGAVFDWIVDKYVDALVLLGVGLSGIAIVSQYIAVPPFTDFAIVAFAIIGSLMNTFIKPVVYAEIGYHEKVEGKIDDPLEGVGFFGRPETFLVLILGGISGFIWVCRDHHCGLYEPFRNPENYLSLPNAFLISP